MKNLIRVELLKLRTTPALYICAAVVGGLTIVSVIANVLLAGKNGGPPLGSVENVNKVFSVAALSTMVAMAIGIVMVAGEYRYRTIMTAYLAEPRHGSRGRCQAGDGRCDRCCDGCPRVRSRSRGGGADVRCKGRASPAGRHRVGCGRARHWPASASACSASPWEPRPGTRSVRSSAQSSGCRSSRCRCCSRRFPHSPSGCRREPVSH